MMDEITIRLARLTDQVRQIQADIQNTNKVLQRILEHIQEQKAKEQAHARL
jgi:molecular chaperone GrpE (heat shock protein)